MEAAKKKYSTIDEYIAAQSPAAKPHLKEIRSIINKAAPGCTEAIGYNMPCFKFGKTLVYFGAAKEHLGFYPMPSVILAFKKELVGFVTSKGAIQFPYSKPLPKKLITQIIWFRLEEVGRG